jgi:hypothetical protein|tara:strand:- start:9893 stop:10309 length:417 start_codon:yes stop_codon:yes gene_type:complete
VSLLDNDSFIQKNIVRDVMRTFGWTLNDYIGYQEFALMRADFYPTGFVLATSKRAIITCDGESQISYNGNIFRDIEELYAIYGKESIKEFNDWDFLVVKEWVIKKNSGEFLTTFTTLKEMPFEKTCFQRKRIVKEEKE